MLTSANISLPESTAYFITEADSDLLDSPKTVKGINKYILYTIYYLLYILYTDASLLSAFLTIWFCIMYHIV